MVTYNNIQYPEPKAFRPQRILASRPPPDPRVGPETKVVNFLGETLHSRPFSLKRVPGYFVEFCGGIGVRVSWHWRARERYQLQSAPARAQTSNRILHFVNLVPNQQNEKIAFCPTNKTKKTLLDPTKKFKNIFHPTTIETMQKLKRNAAQRGLRAGGNLGKYKP